MARNKKRRPHGTGCLLKTNTGWALRWRELEIVADGSTKRVLRYETLGPVLKGEATQTLAERLALAGAKRPLRSHILFETLAAQWEVTVLPMYKHSTQKNHMHILHKHLLPKFGKLAVSEVARQDVQTMYNILGTPFLKQFDAVHIDMPAKCVYFDRAAPAKDK